MSSHSFTGFLDSYGRCHPPQLRRRAGEDFEAWKTTLLGCLEGLRGPVPDRVEPVVRVTETVDGPGHTRHLLEIAVSEHTTLPAYLLVPGDVETGAPRPALLVSHGHYAGGAGTMVGLEEGFDAAAATALSAVQSGYIALAPAWWGWPGRNGHVDRVGGRDKCNVIQMAASMYGLNVLDLHIQDAQAAIDALIARPEVDPERIGCVGNSYGGRTAMWFTIFDQRIRACVAAGSMNTFRERSQELKSCAIQFLPGVLRYADVPELFALIAPRPLQLQAGREDPLITPADRDLIADVVRDAYNATDAGTHFDAVLHDAGHSLSWEPARRFLEEHL